MKFIFGLIMMVSMQASALDCVFQTDINKYCVDIQWKKNPAVNKNSPFVLRFWDQQSGLLINPEGELKLDLWMQMGDFGHGSSPVEIAQLEAGTYGVEEVYFTMRGGWQLRISFVNDKGSISDAAIYQVLVR